MEVTASNQSKNSKLRMILLLTSLRSETYGWLLKWGGIRCRSTMKLDSSPVAFKITT